MSARCNVFIAFVFAVSVGVAYSQSPKVDMAKPIGAFTDSKDVGKVKQKGGARYDSQLQTYQLSGSGKNMWFGTDQFHFLSKEMSGDFILRTTMRFEGDGVDPHRKIGWMIRQDARHDSAYVDATVHGDGLTSMQFRRTRGADTEEIESSVVMPDVIQLERKGTRYTMSVASFGDPLAASESLELDLGDKVSVGLFICAHNPDVVETATFDNVRITTPVADDFRPYQDYIGSRLEIMDVESGKRRVIHTTDDSMQAPNWTLDGRSLIFNRNGRLYRIETDGSDVREIDTDFATKNNNDHVLSFDGQRLGISHHSKSHDGESIIYWLPVEGGKPKQVTPRGPSYLHGWSPDGKWMIFTGGRDEKYDIYKIPVQGGDEIQLTSNAGVNDGSEFTPDGQHIFFNSSRTGRMQLWRMKADGSDQVQITTDESNNWFPHVSPDGKRMVYLAFPKEVEANDHPFYKRVALRLMNLDADGSAQARTIAHLYGGQGTINVPSWSPDGKQIAFVSNSQDP